MLFFELKLKIKSSLERYQDIIGSIMFSIVKIMTNIVLITLVASRFAKNLNY